MDSSSDRGETGALWTSIRIWPSQTALGVPLQTGPEGWCVSKGRGAATNVWIGVTTTMAENDYMHRGRRANGHISAVALFPDELELHIIEKPKSIPKVGKALIRTLAVGIDGSNRCIAAAEIGRDVPDGEDHLDNVINHFWSFTDLGDGILDFEAILETFSDAGHEGHYTIEIENRTHAKRNYDYWSSVGNT